MLKLHRLRGRVRNAKEHLDAFRAYDPVRKRTTLAGPVSVQLQTVDLCNATCPMCPYSFGEHDGPANRMSDELYEKILGELREAGTVRSLYIMLQNEPLLDRQMARKVRRAKEVLGRHVRVGTITNGSALTEKRLDELVDAGLDAISVSIDAYTQKTFEDIRCGLSFDQVIENTERLVRRDDIWSSVRFIPQRANEGEAKPFKDFWRARGAHVEFLSLVNRAGTLDGFQTLRSGTPSLFARARKAAWRSLLWGAAGGHSPTPCPLPFRWLYVLWDGRVILCCHDWGPAEIMGDLSKQTLADVWNGEAMNRQRDILYHDRYRESAVCHDCSIARRDYA